VGDEHLLLGEDHSSHAVGGTRHALAVKLTDVFVSVGAVDAAAVAVESEIELRAVLDDSAVERRQEHM